LRVCATKDIFAAAAALGKKLKPARLGGKGFRFLIYPTPVSFPIPWFSDYRNLFRKNNLNSVLPEMPEAGSSK
jgi:hypothetical protein